MSNHETKPPMPTPETTGPAKSPEQLAHEAAQAAAKAETMVAHEAEKIATDAATAAEHAKTDAAGAKAKAEHEAGVVSAGGTVAGKAKTAEAGPIQQGAQDVAKVAAATGIAVGVGGSKVYKKFIKPVTDWGWDKLKAGWQSFDIWDLSGSKAREKKKK